MRYSTRLIGFSALVLALVLAIGTMWVFGLGWFKQGTADFRGETDARERTVADGSFRIASYDQFFDLCVAVQNQEATITALEQELETEPGQGRVDQINATLTAVRANRTGLINEYNSDAAKEFTIGQFHASNLPATLDPNEEETTCAAPPE